MAKKKWSKKTVAKCNRRLKMYADIEKAGSVQEAREIDYQCDFCSGCSSCQECPCYSKPAIKGGLSCLDSSKTRLIYRVARWGACISTLRAAARARRTYLRRVFIRKGIPIKRGGDVSNDFQYNQILKEKNKKIAALENQCEGLTLAHEGAEKVSASRAVKIGLLEARNAEKLEVLKTVVRIADEEEWSIGDTLEMVFESQRIIEEEAKPTETKGE